MMRLLLPLLAACNHEVRGPETGDDLPLDGCRSTPLPAGGPRVVAVSHPYTATGGQADAWELLSLDGDALTETGTTLSLGRGNGGDRKSVV